MTPRPAFSRMGVQVRGVAAYTVLSGTASDGAIVGEVRPIYLPSRIRRGRAQTEPHWQASDPRGIDVGSPQRTRREAGQLLVDVAFASAAR